MSQEIARYIAAMDAPTVNEPVTRSLKVLLVEDSRVLAERLREVIHYIGGVVLVGTTDTEAVAVAVASKEDVDVIVLDLHLKQGTGFGVMRALAAAQRKPAIIVLSNYDLPEYKKAALALGAMHFLDKARDCGRLSELLVGIRTQQGVSHLPQVTPSN